MDMIDYYKGAKVEYLLLVKIEISKNICYNLLRSKKFLFVCESMTEFM